VKRSRRRFVFEAHRLLYHSTLGLRVIKKKKQADPCDPEVCWDCEWCAELAAETMQNGSTSTVLVHRCLTALFRQTDGLGGVPRKQNMLKRHLPRVIYHQVYEYTKILEGSSWTRDESANPTEAVLQGYLAHKKLPPPTRATVGPWA